MTGAAPVPPVQRAVRALTAVSIVGIALELIVERHWGAVARLIPWFALLASGVALTMLARRPTAATVRAVRIVAMAVLLAGGIGVGLHITENYSAGPLDQRSSAVWETMSEPSRWWAAFTKSVGPAPTFAPAALAEVALLLLISTIGGGAIARGAVLPPR
ncbi:MAG: hypothetical protein M3O64_03810 [Chloroflexota bacterium]|nr:hypothetical protein [Chloroflexota bacterium]